jgi:hypothetical protein
MNPKETVVYIRVPVEQERPQYYTPVFVIMENDDGEYKEELQVWLASDGDNFIWTINNSSITVDTPKYWLKEVKLLTLQAEMAQGFAEWKDENFYQILPKTGKARYTIREGSYLTKKYKLQILYLPEVHEIFIEDKYK